MGVYIDMEMPPNCMLCSFCVSEADETNGEMCMVTGKLMPPYNHERLDDCPIISVPSHEKLIDADALLETMLKLVDEETFRAFRQVINDAPLIIPATNK